MAKPGESCPECGFDGKHTQGEWKVRERWHIYGTCKRCNAFSMLAYATEMQRVAGINPRPPTKK